MNYLFVCRDQARSQPLRDRYLAEHLNHIEAVMDRLVLAGPCPNPDPNAPEEQKMSASALIFEADSEAEAIALFQKDPYFQHGVWVSWDVFPFLPVAGQLVGGKTW